MKLRSYFSSVDDPELHKYLLKSGWEESADSNLLISENEQPSFGGWQIVTNIKSASDRTIAVPEFSAKYLSNVLDLLSDSLSNEYWMTLYEEEKILFDLLFKSKLNFQDEFPLNEFLSFLSSWGDIFEINEREKATSFLIEYFNLDVKILSAENLQLENEFLNYKFILRTHSKDLELYFSFNSDKINEQQKIILVLLIIYQDQKREKAAFEKYSKSDWEIILNNLNYSACLISPKGELVIHNTLFSSLGLYASDCLKLSDGETVECQDKFYKVLKQEVRVKGRDYISYVFITDEKNNIEGSLNTSSEELGIISGSIAHELNNPIAGILAALTLLKLEDDIGEESENLISDMERGARRCQKLIEVFLGFSKLDPTNSQIGTLESSVEQSFQLLRSRMVESNLKMSFDYKQSSPFSRNLNNSIASMIFYLVLSEAFTLGHHHKLLTGNLHQINIEIIEERGEIKLLFFPEMKIHDVTSKSKLLLHLVGLLELEVLGEDNSLIIRNIKKVKYNT